MRIKLIQAAKILLFLKFTLIFYLLIFMPFLKFVFKLRTLFRVAVKLISETAFP
jgi:hypothetical protein